MPPYRMDQGGNSGQSCGSDDVESMSVEAKYDD